MKKDECGGNILENGSFLEQLPCARAYAKHVTHMILPNPQKNSITQAQYYCYPCISDDQTELGRLSTFTRVKTQMNGRAKIQTQDSMPCF